MEQDQELSPNPEYVKGFNEGYILAKEAPELAAKIATALDQSERGNGLKQGMEQLSQERRMDRTPEWLREDFGAEDKDANKGYEMERDDSEPDRD